MTCTGWPTSPASTARLCWCWPTAASGGVRRSPAGARCRVPAAAASVSENAVQLGVNHAVGPTKGRKARSVPVPEFVLDELSVQCHGKAPDDLVFPGPDGPVSAPARSRSAGWFAAAVKRRGPEDHTPRSAAHLRVARDQSAGVNVLALQRMLGHTSAKVTLDTYADLFDDDLDAVAVTLDSRYSHEVWPKCGQRRAHGELQQAQEIASTCAYIARSLGGGGGI